jgi:hypothetical protein
MDSAAQGRASGTAGDAAPPLNAQETAVLESRLTALAREDESYLQGHPEVRALVDAFTRAVLVARPENVIEFAREYFAKQ